MDNPETRIKTYDVDCGDWMCDIKKKYDIRWSTYKKNPIHWMTGYICHPINISNQHALLSTRTSFILQIPCK
jgi:hypothetical protein